MISVFLDTLAARETREEARLLFLEISRLLNQNKCYTDLKKNAVLKYGTSKVPSKEPTEAFPIKFNGNLNSSLLQISISLFSPIRTRYQVLL
jgi:hypothetical protein